jgi:hypothetical protein
MAKHDGMVERQWGRAILEAAEKFPAGDTLTTHIAQLIHALGVP